MGITSSQTASKNDIYGSSISKAEKGRLRDYFEKVCGNATSHTDSGPKTQTNTNQKKSSETLKSFTEESLKIHLEDRLSSNLCSHLFKVMQVNIGNNTEKNTCSETGFYKTLINGIIGSSQDKHNTIYLLSAGNENSVAADGLLTTLQELLKNFTDLQSNPQYKKLSEKLGSIESLAKYLLHDLFHPDIPLKKCKEINFPDKSYTFDEVESWLTKTPIVTTITSAVLLSCFPFLDDSEVIDLEVKNNGFRLPELMATTGKLENCLLDVGRILLINNKLHSSLRHEWTRLFSSLSDGQSFSTFVKQIKNEGPTIIIVHEKSGHTFGGFASESWDLKPHFSGNSTSFLFTLSPSMGVYQTTGYNDHFMYLDQNQQTLPNGLGMGGQLDYFGLWVDGDFGKGKCSKSCTTFESPLLSNEENFEIDALEVWRVGPKPAPPEDEEEGSSALDKNPEATAMLLMIGKQQHSEGIRDHSATADSPEEKELPAL